MEIFREAEPADQEQVIGFYRKMCRQLEGKVYTPLWRFGIYPDEEMLRRFASNGDIWILLDSEDGQIRSSMVLTDDGDSMGLHLFGILEEFQGTGLSDRMMGHLEKAAREAGKQKICLDVIPGNVPAEKLYLKSGFLPTGERTQKIEDGILLEFDLYEKPLFPE